MLKANVGKCVAVAWLTTALGGFTFAAPAPKDASAPNSQATAPQSPAPQSPAPQAAGIEDDEQGWPGLAAGIHIGTLGLGAAITLGLVPEILNLRGGGNYTDFSFSGKAGGDIEYDFTLRFKSFPLMVDIHPFRNGFRISGGAIFNDNKAELAGQREDSVTIGDHEYTQPEYGTLSGEIKFEKEVAPYVGIGFGNAVGPDTSFSFVFDLGVMFESYDVTLDSQGGTQSGTPGMLADLAIEEQKTQDDVDKVKVYPVLAFGLAYHF